MLKGAIAKSSRSLAGLTVIRVDGALLRLLAYVITGVACVLFALALPVFLRTVEQVANLGEVFSLLLKWSLFALIGFVFSSTAVSLLIDRLLWTWFLFVLAMLVVSAGLLF